VVSYYKVCFKLPEDISESKHMSLFQLKQGPEFNSAPQRKLSQSFALDLVGATNSNKQALLAAVGQIVASHGQYKRSADAHFKAFVCAGLK
jgi:hypothetical protein